MTAARWSPERWRRVQEILDCVLACEPGAREACLERSCGDDEALFRETAAFLSQEDEIGDFIEKSVVVRRSEPEDGPDAGRRLGPYRLVRRIAHGGMGDVYLAEREGDYETRVAIKLIQRDQESEEVSRRFVHERQILAQLDHPFIARLLDGGATDDGRPYFVMEHVEGDHIDTYCDTRALPVRHRLELFCKVCEAVDLAHKNLVVHRDLKPLNILVTEDGAPKLLDFGIAKLIGADGTSELTEALAPMTFRYASPEQLVGEPITTASDVYSLGLVLYQLLTGRLPWDLDLTASPNLQAVSGTPPRRPSSAAVAAAVDGRDDLDPERLSRSRRCTPRRLRGQLSGDLDAIVLKALRREAGKRYGSVAELAEDVRHHLAGLPIRARKGTLSYRTAKLLRRRKVELSALVVLLALGAGLARTAVEAAGERRKAETVVGFLERVIQLPDPRHRPDPRTVVDQVREKIAGELGDEPELQATVMDALGRTYGALGFLDTAHSLVTEALAIRRQVYGDEHPLVAESMINLGYLLRLRDQIQEAAPLMRDALAILRRRFEGRDDRMLAHALTNYAGLLKDLGEYGEAERLYRESLAMKERLYGAGHTEVARGLGNLGALLEDRGRYDEAEAYFERALAIRRSDPRPDDPELAQSLQHVARLLYHRQAYAEAIDLFREVVDARRRIYGNRHLEVATGLNNLAVCLQRQGRLVEAEPLLREALAIRLEELGDNHHDVAVSRRNLAGLLLDLGRPEEAVVPARQALAGFLASRPKSYWRSADARSVLGACLAALGRFEEAEQLLVESHQALLEDKGASSVYTRDARQRLIHLYESWGKPEKAP